MVNPYNERLEAMERDLFKNKKAISALTRQVKKANKELREGLLDGLRRLADSSIYMHQLWLTYYLDNEVKKNKSLGENAAPCYRFMGNHRRKAEAAIKESDNPMLMFDKWFRDCTLYLRKQGFLPE